MSVAKARSRLVSFRLTDEELENLRVACVMRGARNISEFARNAVLDLSEARVQPAALVLDRFSALELRLAEVEAAVQHNGEMLRAVLKSLVKQGLQRPARPRATAAPDGSAEVAGSQSPAAWSRKAKGA